MENPMGNFDSTTFLNRFLSVLADIVSEQNDVRVSLVATPKNDEGKQPA